MWPALMKTISPRDIGCTAKIPLPAIELSLRVTLEERIDVGRSQGMRRYSTSDNALGRSDDLAGADWEMRAHWDK